MIYRNPFRTAGRTRWRGFSNVHRILCGLLATLQLLFPCLVAALPTDGHVVGGNATVQQINPNTLNVVQASERAILNWKSFSIAADEAVHFVQPSVNSIALNRVIGTDPSVILGRLQSNGRIFLLNPNGILFGAGAQINVGGLLATTLQIRDEDFMAGRYLFTQDPLKELRSVINRGTIQVSEHGYAFLVAPGVSNEGLIVANLGKVVLGSGQALTVDLMGDGLINYALSGKVLDQVTDHEGKPLVSAVSNSGTIQADGGHVVLQAKAAGEIFSSVVNQSGIVRARSLKNHGGVVQLLGGEETLIAATDAGAMRPAGEVSGAVVNSGTIDVSAGEPNAAQGSVTMVGERVGHFGAIQATGADGASGGDVVMASTTRSLLADSSTVDVSGIGRSSAGSLRVWSDQDTFFNPAAVILARGGNLGGNGGFVEVSGKELLGFSGTVDALAPFGSAGILLLDPRNITIAAAGAAYNPGVNNLFGNTPGADVTISAGSINAAGANVVLQANNDITVGSAINMTNAGVGIAMQAGRDILVNAAISTNNGNISLTANDAGAVAANRLVGTGDIVFGAGSNLSAGTGNINLSIGSSAAAPFSPGSITTVRNLTTTTGNISINSRNTVTLSGAANAGSGTVSINANSDGAGAEGFTMNAGSSIATTNSGASAVQIVVNSPAGGTGAASLRGSITTGNGGTATVSTRGQAAAGGNTTGGAITQGAALTINTGAGGAIGLATGATTADITLNTPTNDFTGSVGVSRARNVTLQDANALDLGASTISGNMAITAGGAVTDSGNLTSTAGASTLTVTTLNNAGAPITLDSAGNNFVNINLSARNAANSANAPGAIAYRDVNAVNVAQLRTAGSASLTTGGAITQSGAVTVTGTTSLTAGAGNNITLTNAGNDFTDAVSVVSGNNVSLRDANALILGASTVSGTLGVTTAGALTQSGALNVTGTTTLAAGAANNITLTNAANNFSTVGVTSGNNVALTDTNALILGASTVSGTLGVTTNGALTQSGALTVTGVTTLAAGAANNITLTNAANNFSTVGITSGNNVSLRDANALILGGSMVSGAFDVTTAGAITQSGALTVTGVTTLAAGAANNITLTNAANNFSTVGITSGANVSLTDSNALVLGASTVSGNLALTTGGTLSQTGALAVTGTSSFSATAANTDLLLDTQANNFVGVLSFLGAQANFRDVQLRNVNAGATVPGLAGLTNLRNLTLTYNNAPVTLPTLTLTAGGNLNVTAGGAITDTGNLIVSGTTTLTAGANNITLDNANNFTGAVSVVSGNNVTLNDVNALDLGASTISGTLNVTTAGAITQSGALAVTGTTTLAAGAANNITLTNAANNFSTVGITSGNNVALVDSNALTLGASTVSGTLNVTTNGGLTQSGAVTVVGGTTLAAGPANNITLTNAGNNFSTVAVTSGNNVALRDANALVLGTSTVSGTLDVTTAGALTQSGVLNVTGTTTLAAGVGNNIDLSTFANNFSTVGITSGNNVALTDVNALNLAASTVSGTLNVTTGGPLTQSGAVIVAGVTTLAAGGNDISLTNAGNNFSTVGITSGNNVALVDSNVLTLGASTVSGTLNVTTNGTLTQSGAVTVTGTTTLQAGAANDITLTNAGNNFSTIGITSGNNVALTDADALNLAASTVSGTLAMTTNGALTQSGAVTVAGATTLAAGTANDITLTNAGNNFGTVSVTSGNNVALTDANALGLGASTVSGNLNVTTNGALTQSGAVTVAGVTTLAAGAGNNITLTNGGNNFNSVGVTSGNNVSLTDANALTLNASNVSGALTANAADLTVGGAVASTGGALNLNATNSVTQSANLSTAGANTVTVTAGGPLTMAAAATTTSGTGAINYTAGTNVTLGSLSTGGGVSVSANGGSVLSAAGSGTNVTAGANSSLQAFNGVVGTQANPMTVNVNPGTLSIRATTAVAGISAFLTGTVLPSNALTLLNVPPGLVCFNGCPVPSSSNPLGGFFGLIPSINKESIVPSYSPESSAPPLISIVSTYVPGTVVAEAETDVTSDDQSVAREIPPCFPASACKPGATLLTMPVAGVDETINAR